MTIEAAIEMSAAPPTPLSDITLHDVTRTRPDGTLHKISRRRISLYEVTTISPEVTT